MLEIPLTIVQKVIPRHELVLLLGAEEPVRLMGCAPTAVGPGQVFLVCPSDRLRAPFLHMWLRKDEKGDILELKPHGALTPSGIQGTGSNILHTL